MDAVKAFNQELSSLYEIKPPISKAKMTSITKGAIKGIKFYKHVVQSVEKFIQKCRPEYKIPGLYVIDSIVRQSRHQFGPEKDVFAPRFAKNVNVTFWHLYKCAEDEKSKVIRVLNLWQKNEVFSSEVIQPLFDLANPNSDMSKQVEEQIKRGNEKKSAPTQPPGAITVVAPESIMNTNPNLNSLPPSSASSASIAPPIIPDQQVIQQLQTIQQLLKNHLPHTNDQVKFNKKVLDDFDYSDEDDAENENSLPPAAMIEALQGILGNERVLQQLKSMGAISNNQIQQLQQLLPSSASHYSPIVQPSPVQSQSQQPIQQTQGQVLQMPPPSSVPGWNQPKPPPPQQIITLELEEGERVETDEDIQIVEDRSSYGRRSRSRERSKRHRSRSRSPGSSKRRSSRRSRSRSRERSSRRRERDRERDEEREKRKEREKKGLPPIKKEHLSVCSTTLWVGHLSRLVAEDQLSDIFGEYGEIVSIDLIPPRGCAFVCMNRRMDATKALKSLYKYKINGKPIILAWAPGKGMKDKQWKDYWDVELGVSYIPINKLDPQVNMAELEEGGMFDEDTMPEWMKTMRGVAPNPTAQVASAPTGTPVVPAPTAAPQFIPVPEGIPPVMEPPPGLNFSMPIPPPGAIPPPNMLLGHPRFGGPPPPPPPPAHLPGGFDASQPPPGLRLPFPPPIPGGANRVGVDKLNIPPPDDRNVKWKGETPGSSHDEIANRLRSLAGDILDDQLPSCNMLGASDPSESDSYEDTNGGPQDGGGLRDGDHTLISPKRSDENAVGRMNQMRGAFIGRRFDNSPHFHRLPNAGRGGINMPRGMPPFRPRGGRRGRGIFADHWHDRERYDGHKMNVRNVPPWFADAPWSDGPRRGRGRGGPRGRGFDREFVRHGDREFEPRDRFFERGRPNEFNGRSESNFPTPLLEDSVHSDTEKDNLGLNKDEKRKNRRSRWGEKEENDPSMDEFDSVKEPETFHANDNDDEEQPDQVSHITEEVNVDPPGESSIQIEDSYKNSEECILPEEEPYSCEPSEKRSLSLYEDEDIVMNSVESNQAAGNITNSDESNQTTGHMNSVESNQASDASFYKNESDIHVPVTETVFQAQPDNIPFSQGSPIDKLEHEESHSAMVESS